VKINWYLISSGRLREQPPLTNWPTVDISKFGESWFDIEDAKPEEIVNFLAPLGLHPVMIKRCSDSTSTPGVTSYDNAILLEFPVAPNLDSLDPTYITIVLRGPVLVTIRSCPMPAIKELLSDIAAEKIPSISHLIQIVYLILDELTDLSVQAETEARDKTLNIAKILVDNPAKVEANDLANLRWQVEKLISLIENQLYCITGLDSSDNETLVDPHRRAYIKDLLSELEIAQMGIQRLETRVNGLYDSYQAMSNSRVDKRLRILTIISAITLPFSLIAGLLGMNVGGLPGIQNPQGFIIVIILMAVIGVVELWYFKRKGWLD
jgi:magnesium/cobalt transport protein CorA